MLKTVMTVGAAALWYSLPISFAVLGLLIILILSYRQTIFSYPSVGGAYIVAKDNIGVASGLMAGGSLLVDYILTVAVSSSAGTDAITSAIPQLHDHRVLISLIMITFLTLMNLRGITESASVLALPVYLFVISIFVLIICGIVHYATGGMYTPAPPYGATLSGVSLFLLLKAFSSGCSAPLVKFIETVEWKTAESDHITILIPQFITKHWWQNILHNQTSLLLRAYLFTQKDIVVATVPYHLNR